MCCSVITARTGPWSASLIWYHGERTFAAAPTTSDADIDSYHASGSYALGPGVTLVGTLGFTSLGDTSGGLGADSDSTYIVVGPKLSF